MTKKIVMLVALLFCSFVLVSCGDKITEETLQNLEFKDATIEYDGELHSIFIENIYEEQGVTIKYKNNKKSMPGEYVVKATITFEEIKVEKEAKMTITKKKSVLSAEAEQTFYMNDGVDFKYELNNDDQPVVIKNDLGMIIDASTIGRPGTYNLELYALGSKTHEESNHVNVKIVVLKSKYDINFVSKEVVADGTEKKVEIEGTLPSGYTVEYENNTGTEAGKYYATANIKDASGTVVETHKAVLNIENPENEEFAEFLDDFFVEYLEEDQLSVNIFCENPADFGLEHYDAEWYTFEKFDDADLAHDIKYFEELLKELAVFKDAKLNEQQQIAYDNIEGFLNFYIEFYAIEDAIYMKTTYVDQFGGYVADFGTYMEAYSLRSELEVKDVVDYIKSTKEAFPSYLIFVQEKLDRGYGLSDFTLNEMRGYLKDLIDAEEGYYLEGVLHEKISKLDFLTDEAKASYKQQITDAINDCFMVGVQELYDGLEKFIGKVAKEDEGYWATYENGKTLYELTLEDLLGYDDIDIKLYIKELEAEINATNSSVINTQRALINKYNISSYHQLENVINNNSIFEGTPDEMMVYLKEFAKYIVPELKSAPDIVIKEMDEASAKVSNAVAYYMKSALDNTGSEYITLNPVTLLTSTNNDIIGTLAHEGYPGHLYAYVYSKEQGLSNLSTIMTSTAHGEGWATYVELKLYEYAKSLSTNEDFGLVMDYLYANQLSGFLLETRLDAGIHYEGWTVSDVSAYLDKLGYNADAAQEIYDLIIETPTQYASYGYGKLVFNKIHNQAKAALGVYYDEIEFNAMILSNGWVELEVLEEMVDAYLDDKCFEYGIER